MSLDSVPQDSFDFDALQTALQEAATQQNNYNTTQIDSNFSKRVAK